MNFDVQFVLLWLGSAVVSAIAGVEVSLLVLSVTTPGVAVPSVTTPGVFVSPGSVVFSSDGVIAGRVMELVVSLGTLFVLGVVGVAVVEEEAVVCPTGGGVVGWVAGSVGGGVVGSTGWVAGSVIGGEVADPPG